MTARALPIAATAIVAAALLAWIGLAAMSQSMPAPDMSMGMLTLAVMWVIMMLAMMAPAAAPSYLLYSRMSQHPAASMAYLAGYLGIWCLAGIIYALAHWELQQAGLLGSGMRLTEQSLAGVLLVAAGFWQWSPVKARCVARCRSPLGFMMTDWRDGIRGALMMGGHYALWCVGCCWLLMVMLFVVGAMSVFWAAVISVYILTERLFALGPVFDRGVGVALIICGGWLMSAAVMQ